MSPIQQMLLGAGVVATKIYVDDCFFTHAYEGNSSTSGQNITGSDFTPDLVWIKGRNHTANHILVDSVRGNDKVIYSNTNDDEDTNEDYVNSRFEGGFKVGNSGITNGSNETNVAWTWKKQEGFFDIVKYTGGIGTQTISHNLGCVPGMILVKALDTSDNWAVYHRNMDATSPNNYGMKLNTTNARFFGAGWNVTATTFDAAISLNNSDGADFIAYLFAGGKSTTDKAVDFDGSGDYLSLPSTTDLNLTGDFTIEFWVYPRSQSTSRQTILQTNRSWGAKYAVLQIQNDTQSGIDKKAQLWDYDMNNGMPIIYSNTDIEEDEWTHIAFTRESGTIKIYINGKLDKTETGLSDSIEFGDTSSFIGNHSNSYYLNAKLSNLRIVNGQALYTTNFNVPHDPLTQTSQNAVSSNVKLLCCNGNTAAASTVTPVTITANGDPTVTSNDSIFDDTAAHVFGESGSESVIKCGSYVGSGSAGLEVNLGFEPQWIMVKNASTSAKAWFIHDNMRGIVSGGNEPELYADSNSAEVSNERISLTPTGFKVDTTSSGFNTSGDTYIYTCIRRPDGYVGKPPELGSNCFQMDMGNASSSIPAFDSGFPVDMAFTMDPSTTGNKLLGTRLTGQNFYITNSTTNSDTSDFVWDSHTGCFKNYGSNNQAWMWKRGKAFDVVIYKGNDSTRVLNHSLNAVPQMMWVWNVANGYQKYVYHSGSNQGSSPWTKEHRLNATEQEVGSPFWGSSLPTSSTFNIGASSNINGTGNTYIAMLFANVDGISKCGYFTGSSSAKTLTVGFQARFFLVKRVDDATGQANWNFFDSQRGMASAPANFGEQTFTTPGTHTWTCPSGVSSVSVVCVGGGGEAGKANSNDASGGGGGALAYKNSISVTAGSNYTVTVGAGGSGASGFDANGNAGGSSSFTGYGGTLTAGGGGGGKGGASNGGGSGGSPSGHDGGGSGGNGGSRNPAQGGGGGAGGYSGNGGNGLGSYPGSSGAGSGGGGGGGYQAGGGGVGLGGEGASGASSNSGNNGKGGSGGEDTTESSGGKYGGGGKSSSGDGADGAVRIVWSTDGTTRSFPSTNVATYDDKRLTMNTTAKSTGGDYLGLTSTEIILTAGQGEININNAKYIYYAHA